MRSDGATERRSHEGVARCAFVVVACAVLVLLGACRAAPDAAPARPERIEPFPGVVVLPGELVVELETRVCIDGGWLEQIACMEGTRVHESLVVPRAMPSEIHASLLMAGFEPGTPGSWSLDENDEVVFTAPRGPALDVVARYERDGAVVEEPIARWIRDHRGRQEFPDEPWIFGGSRFDPNPKWMDEGEHYVADLTGSVIGLVTFGDEVVGFSRVLADQEAVQAAEWEVDTEAIPPPDTPVTLILRPWHRVGASFAE
ncbi:MAG: hypothetical protein GY715_00590 [Planctomycetes bacterium]|nr:hypothetical protein [Planctomycetota bacterium]